MPSSSATTTRSSQIPALATKLSNLLRNFLHEPSLLSATPNGKQSKDFFRWTPGGEHYTQTISINDPADRFLFTDVGLHLLRSLDHVYFRISTTVEVSASQQQYYAVAYAQAFDSAGEEIYVPDIRPGRLGDTVMLSVRQRMGIVIPISMPDISPTWALLFNWKCVVEYLKYGTRIAARGEAAREKDPLIQCGIGGDGLKMYRFPTT